MIYNGGGELHRTRSALIKVSGEKSEERHTLITQRGGKCSSNVCGGDFFAVIGSEGNFGVGSSIWEKFALHDAPCTGQV